MESPARVIASQAIPARGGRYPRNSLEPGSAKLNFGPWIAVPNLASGTMDFSALCELGPRPIAVCLRRSRVCMTEQHQEPQKDVSINHSAEAARVRLPMFLHASAVLIEAQVVSVQFRDSTARS